jgi:hypothetical protein
VSAPQSFTPTQAAYVEDLERRLEALENPGSPTAVYACLEAALPDPTAHRLRVVLVTDLNVLAHSDGSDWIRADDGSAI